MHVVLLSIMLCESASMVKPFLTGSNAANESPSGCTDNVFIVVYITYVTLKFVSSTEC